MGFPGTPLPVPDFNKQEVEGIAVDAVKGAISKGDIPLPPGGTKLYKHMISFNTTSSAYPNTTITFLSNDVTYTKQSFSEKDKFELIFSATSGISQHTGSSYSIYVSDAKNNNRAINKLQIDITNGTSTLTEIYDGTSEFLYFTDTVTEL